MIRRFPPLSAPPAASLDGESVRIVIALGSNLGAREQTITEAAARIARLPLVEDLRLSSLQETVALRPEGWDPDAPRYRNAVAVASTRLAPDVLMGLLHAIENEYGRDRQERWGDRTLDLDLITYGNLKRSDASLTLPHPRAAQRLFVLEPWLELDPDAQLDGVGVAEIIRVLRASDTPGNQTQNSSGERR